MLFCEFTGVLDEISRRSATGDKVNLLVGLFERPEVPRGVVAKLIRCDFDTRLRKISLRKLVRFPAPAQKPSSLSVGDIYQSLVCLEGRRDNEGRTEVFERVLPQLDRSETKYFCCLVTNSLRIGVKIMTLLKALAVVYTVAPDTVYRVYKTTQNLDDVIGTPWLNREVQTTLKLFRPVHLMLAKCGKPDCLNLKQYIVEPKYDGMRGQIHYEASTQKYRVYSRTCNEEKIRLDFHSPVDLILDSEIVYVDLKEGKILEFNYVQNRLSMEEREGVQAVAFVFDILLYGTESLLETPLWIRKEILGKLGLTGASVRPVPVTTVESVEELYRKLDEVKDSRLEGLVIKCINEPYYCDRRVWFKLKRDIDTYDLAVIGGYRGNGNREGFYGSLLLGVPEGENFVDVCKVGTGFTTGDLVEFKKELRPSLVTYETRAPRPDVFFDGSMVVEVKASGVTVGRDGRPSLRFPVFIRVRPDKDNTMTTRIRTANE